jgi:class 3 adenylate cyclase
MNVFLLFNIISTLLIWAKDSHRDVVIHIDEIGYTKWIFVGIIGLQILLSKRLLPILMVKLLTINMHVITLFAKDFQTIYMIRVLVWLFATPVFLDVLPYKELLLLQENKRDWCCVLHRAGYTLEIIGILFNINSMFYHAFVYAVFGFAYVYANMFKASHSMYIDAMKLILASYGVIHAFYLFGYISPYQQWLLYNICDVYAKGLLAYLINDHNAGVRHAAMCNGNYIMIFFDLEGFTYYSRNVFSADVAHVLDDLYSRIDKLLVTYDRVQKVETVGDEYMAVVKLNMNVTEDDGESIRQAFFFVQSCLSTILEFKNAFVGSRAGMNAGQVTKAMIGIVNKRIQYFGSAVNIASRMESTSKRNMLRITDNLYELAKSVNLNLIVEEEYVNVKGIGLMKTYLVDILASPIVFPQTSDQPNSKRI